MHACLCTWGLERAAYYSKMDRMENISNHQGRPLDIYIYISSIYMCVCVKIGHKLISNPPRLYIYNM